LTRDTGYSVRIYNLAKGLSQHGNKVHVIIPGFSVKSEKIDGFFVHKFRGFLPKKVLFLVSKLLGIAKPTSLYFYDPLFILRVRNLICQADVVQIEQQTAGGLLVPIINIVWKKPVTIDCHDVFQSLRVKHTFKIRQILEIIVEIFTYKFANIILTVSEKEKEILTSCGIRENKIKVVTNGVDIVKFDRSTVDISHVKKKYGLDNCHVIIFVGNMEYLPNREAVKLIAAKIAPLVWQEIANTKFVLVGRYNKKINLPNLIFTGVVNDVVELLAISDVAIAPLFHASGTRLKILEYLSCGLPVVSTSKGIEGLNLKNTDGLIIKDDLNDFAKNIVMLIKNQIPTEKLRKDLRNSVLDYDWKNISIQLHETYKGFLSAKS
jgi:glycosyltransferase involved in cell wall biosynthesis